MIKIKIIMPGNNKCMCDYNKILILLVLNRYDEQKINGFGLTEKISGKEGKKFAKKTLGKREKGNVNNDFDREPNTNF